MNLSGLHVPIVSPFSDDDRLDVPSLERLIGRVLDAGADGIVALGTTGEPATLTDDERRTVVRVCREICRDRGAALTVGAGSNATAASEAVVAQLDPDIAAVLVIVPYYTRPSEAGVVEHLRRVAAASPAPVLVYDNPPRTGRPLSLDTLRAVAALPNVVGFKYAPGVLDETSVRFVTECAGATTILAGDDLHVPAMLALGADGAIAAAANIAPDGYVRLHEAWRAGDLATARELWRGLAPLTAALFAEPNPTVIKGVLARLGIIGTAAVRLPLQPASAEAVARAMQD